jgi:hypothetical protein
MKNWPRCPNCKSKDVELIEIWDASISWLPDDPYFNEGVLTPGDPKKVEGKCLSCNHTWRLHGVVQVQQEWFVRTAITTGGEG